MNIQEKIITLGEDTFAYINRASDEENAEIFKEEIKKYIDIISKLVNTEFKELSDREFYDLLCKAYHISLQEEDYLKIISKINNKKYNRFTQIGTFMTFKDMTTEGRGRDFSWWQQLYQVRYVVAVAEGCDIQYCSDFSKTDIKKMIDDKSIVIVGEIDQPLNRPYFKEETVEDFPSMNLKVLDLEWGVYGSIYEDDENFPIIVSMLRRKFTKKRILKDMKDYIEKLKYQIDNILIDWSEDRVYGGTAKLCEKWFNESEEKKEYIGLQKEIDKKLFNYKKNGRIKKLEK